MSDEITRNHYYPQFLIRNWINENNKQNTVTKNIIKTYYENEKRCKQVASKQILFGNEIYDNDTEKQTSKDDNKLSDFIKSLKNNSSSTNKTFYNSEFLRLIFKLFARQQTPNEKMYESVYNEIMKCPYLSLGVKGINSLNPSDKIFERWVNHNQYVNNDISNDYTKCKYTFYINETDIPFILPDNVKTFLLPLTPKIVVGISTFTLKKPEVEIKVININDIDFSECKFEDDIDKKYKFKYTNENGDKTKEKINLREILTDNAT